MIAFISRLAPDNPPWRVEQPALITHLPLVAAGATSHTRQGTSIQTSLHSAASVLLTTAEACCRRMPYRARAQACLDNSL